MADVWNRTSDRTTTRVVPPAQRSDGADIRRNYNRMIKNQQKRITVENQEFFSPEYLQQEKFYVLNDISKLKQEIKPLTIQYQKLLAEKEKVLPTPEDGGSPERTELYSDITEEQKNRQQLEEELARERRHYSDGTRFKLQYEIQTDTQKIQSILDQIEGEKAMIEQKNKQLESITNSQLADTIRSQDQRIDQLQSQLRDLQAEEKTLKQKAIEYMKDASYSSGDARELNAMKKKLQILDTIQLRKSSEYRKRRNELEKQAQSLRDQIAEKKKKKQERQEKENWKKNLKIKEIVVTEDDYVPYQPRTMVNHAVPQNQGLPPLNPNSSRKRTPRNKQRPQYTYRQQNENDYYNNRQEQQYQAYQNQQQQSQEQYYYDNNQNYNQNQQEMTDENYNNYQQTEEQQQQTYQQDQQYQENTQNPEEVETRELGELEQQENNDTSINIIPDVLAQHEQQGETQENIQNQEQEHNENSINIIPSVLENNQTQGNTQNQGENTEQIVNQENAQNPEENKEHVETQDNNSNQGEKQEQQVQEQQNNETTSINIIPNVLANQETQENVQNQVESQENKSNQGENQENNQNQVQEQQNNETSINIIPDVLANQETQENVQNQVQTQEENVPQQSAQAL